MLNLNLAPEKKLAIEVKYRKYEQMPTNDLRETLLDLMSSIMLLQVQEKYAMKERKLLANPKLDLHQELELHRCKLGVCNLTRFDLLKLLDSATTQIAIHQQVLSQLLQCK